MNGLTLEEMFREFLISKGYPKESLISEFTLGVANKESYRVDMIILDRENKEYLALFEFSTTLEGKMMSDIREQFFKYFGYLKTNLIPAYLILSSEQDGFSIFVLANDGKFLPVPKQEFPSYETLSLRRATDEKMKFREMEEMRSEEIASRRRSIKWSSYFAILSLVTGVIASIGAIFFQQDNQNRRKEISTAYIDSLQNKYLSLNHRLEDLQKSIVLNSGKAAIKVDTLFISSQKLNTLEKRLSVIELGISGSPERTLSLIEMRHEIAALEKSIDFARELEQSKIDALKAQVDIQNAWILGVLIAIFGTILALVIPNIIPRRPRN